LAQKPLQHKPVYKPVAFAGVRHSSGDHSKLWGIERMVSAGLLALIPASLALPIPGADYALALALVAHVHWGVEAIVVDYIRPSIFGATIPKISVALLFMLSALSLSGLLYFNYTDVGMVQGTKMAWRKL
jgi:succinate dehydrogenase (ubiquinone) membrane anchor subunit